MALAMDEPSLSRLAIAGITARGAGMAVAWLLEHPRCDGVRAFVQSRVSLRPLLDYSRDWRSAILSEGIVVAVELVLLTAAAAVAPRSVPIRLAAAVSDSVAVAPFHSLVRRLVAPLPPSQTSRHAVSSKLLPSLTPSSAIAFGIVQAIRTATRTAAVLVLRRYAAGDTYLRRRGILVQSVAQGAITGSMTAAATWATLTLLRGAWGGPHRYSTWALTFGGAWAAATAAAVHFTSVLNERWQARIAQALYRRLPGVRNARQRVFDLKELDGRFATLSATELGEVSQFANEALRSAAIDQNTRLHAVRFLAQLTEYVRAVNAGVLRRAAKVPSTASMNITRSSAASLSTSRSASPTRPARPVHSDADFPTHEFKESQIAERAKSGSEPFACARCQGRFQPKDKACILPCGHLLHQGDCAKLLADWCPACVRPTHSPNNDERTAIFIGMKAFVESLALEWESQLIIPEHLRYAEWGYVAQFVRRHRVVEGEVPLDVVPATHVPGNIAILELPLAGALWALRLAPTDCTPHALIATKGW